MKNWVSTIVYYILTISYSLSVGCLCFFRVSFWGSCPFGRAMLQDAQRGCQQLRFLVAVILCDFVNQRVQRGVCLLGWSLVYRHVSVIRVEFCIWADWRTTGAECVWVKGACDLQVCACWNYHGVRGGRGRSTVRELCCISFHAPTLGTHPRIHLPPDAPHDVSIPGNAPVVCATRHLSAVLSEVRGPIGIHVQLEVQLVVSGLSHELEHAPLSEIVVQSVKVHDQASIEHESHDLIPCVGVFGAGADALVEVTGYLEHVRTQQVAPPHAGVHVLWTECFQHVKISGVFVTLHFLVPDLRDLRCVCLFGILNCDLKKKVGVCVKRAPRRVSVCGSQDISRFSMAKRVFTTFVDFKSQTGVCLLTLGNHHRERLMSNEQVTRCAMMFEQTTIPVVFFKKTQTTQRAPAARFQVVQDFATRSVGAGRVGSGGRVLTHTHTIFSNIYIWVVGPRGMDASTVAIPTKTPTDPVSIPTTSRLFFQKNQKSKIKKVSPSCFFAREKETNNAPADAFVFGAVCFGLIETRIFFRRLFGVAPGRATTSEHPRIIAWPLSSLNVWQTTSSETMRSDRNRSVSVSSMAAFRGETEIAWSNLKKSANSTEETVVKKKGSARIFFEKSFCATRTSIFECSWVSETVGVFRSDPIRPKQLGWSDGNPEDPMKKHIAEKRVAWETVFFKKVLQRVADFGDTNSPRSHW